MKKEKSAISYAFNIKKVRFYYSCLILKDFFLGPGTVEPIALGLEKIFPGAAHGPRTACFAGLL
jgi:hypothetical protein